MKKTFSILLVFIMFYSCKNNVQKTEIQKQNPFDSLMTVLVSKYPELPKPHIDSMTFSQVYRMEKRIFIPYLVDTLEEEAGLNFELRQFTPCGGCWDYRVIHIYNKTSPISS